MATTDPLPPKVRKDVAAQTAKFFAPLQAAPAGAAAAPVARVAPKLAEDFVHCVIAIKDVENPPADLSALLEPKGSWAHTIRQGKVTTRVAFSQQHWLGEEKNSLLGMFEGELAAKIDEAAKWLDENDKDDNAVVRLLEFPAYYTFAFGIIREKKLFAVLISQPDDFKQLQLETEYPLKDFLAKLAKEPHA